MALCVACSRAFHVTTLPAKVQNLAVRFRARRLLTVERGPCDFLHQFIDARLISAATGTSYRSSRSTACQSNDRVGRGGIRAWPELKFSRRMTCSPQDYFNRRNTLFRNPPLIPLLRQITSPAGCRESVMPMLFWLPLIFMSAVIELSAPIQPSAPITPRQTPAADGFERFERR